jgi:chromate reductase, NAD(P)H dehydrogenase (quinone)
VLLVSGSLRRASTNTALLRAAARYAPEGIACRVYDDLALLPAFNPDDDHSPLPAGVAHLRNRVHDADAILFSTPEYAGALPGSLKNLLDWTIGDAEVGSIYQKPVGWVNASPRGADGAHRELQAVLGYAHARVVEGACLHMPITPGMIRIDGQIDDQQVLVSLASVLRALADASRGGA